MQIAELQTAIEQCMMADRHRFKRQLDKIAQQQSKKTNTNQALTKLHANIVASLTRAQQRQAQLPTIDYPDLPISERRDDIIAALHANPVVIVAGETGSGKTTQLPKISLQAGRGIHGTIGHTQPRRIAARTVSQRIAEELKVKLGEAVGYQVRFTDQTNPDTLIKIMTDGILLAEIQQDPFLNRYDTIIIDEAHERSLNIDFLLGYLKRLQLKRPELKIIVTSATIDVDRFSNHFNKAPIIEVSGRTYPVDIYYQPVLDEYEDMPAAIVGTVANIIAEDSKVSNSAGDMLVFLAGERDIRETALALRKAQIPHLDILPLYARLSLAEQTRVFQSHRGRRVVLATNVAETSLTVPGIRYVIDTGFARISRYSFRTKVLRLPIEPIAQASANQRAGRAGRLSHGVCIRLYEEQDFQQRPEFTEAEILRSNLASVILQMAQLRLGDIHQFPFVDSPDPKLVSDGYKLLEELGALDKKNHLTLVGRQLSQLPVDPRFARMCIAAKQFDCLRELLIIVSGLSIQDPRERPADKQHAADEKHRRFWDKQSDFLAYINLWNYVEEQRQALTQNQLRNLCKREFLSWLRLREWRDLHHQLRLAIKSLRWQENREPANYESVHRALVSGLLGNIGNQTEERQYLGPRNRKFSIFPGSSQFKSGPKWLIAAEMIETSKLFAHCVAKVEPEWLLAAAKHLVKRHHFEPHFDGKRGQVLAFERVTLYGLTLVEKRRVNYADINPVEAREIFIRGALVEMRYRYPGNQEPAFIQHNRALFADVEELEAKARRRDILVDDSAVYEFFAQKLPDTITNQQGFDHWRKRAEQDNPQVLLLDRELLMRHDAEAITEAQFPNSITVGDMAFALQYCFEPGHQQDGVNLQIPIHALHLLQETQLEWLVPGLLHEKCIELIKSLPKQLRKKFVPVPDAVARLLPHIVQQRENKSLTEAISYSAGREMGIAIKPEDWQPLSVDNFYRFNIQVLDEQGKVIDQNRDLAILRATYKQRLQNSLRKVGGEFEQLGLQDWTFSELPENYQLQKGNITTIAFPALLDRETAVDLNLVDDRERAATETRRGIARLLLLQLRQQCKYFYKELFKQDKQTIILLGLGELKNVQDDVLMTAMDTAADLGHTLPRSHREFEQRLAAATPRFTEQVNSLAKVLSESIRAYADVIKKLAEWRGKPVFDAVANDIRTQLQTLFQPGFVYASGLDVLNNLPRYLQGIDKRMEKAQGQLQKDLQQLDTLHDYLDPLAQLEAAVPAWRLRLNPDYQHYLWMLQEYRLSIFAQPMKTAMPISAKRLDKHWQKLKPLLQSA